MSNGESVTRPAQAQELGVPTEQADGSLVFSGEFSQINEAEFDTVTTQPFELTGGTVTITVESEPSGEEPIVFLVDEGLSYLSERDGNSLTELVYDNVDAGNYTLEITSITAPNVEGNYTITVSEGSAIPDPDPTPPDRGGGAPTDRPSDDLLRSGGPIKGPLPLMRDGTCPKEYPVRRGQTCNAR